MISVSAYQQQAVAVFAGEGVQTDRFQLRPRVRLSRRDLQTLENRVRNRIFNKGENAAGRKYPYAEGVSSGFHNYDTGQLFRGFKVVQRGFDIVMICSRSSSNRREIAAIIAALDKRQGPTYRFSQAEKADAKRMAVATERKLKTR